MDKYEDYKGKLRGLLQRMETSTAEEGMARLDAFVREYEESLYNELGRLTRQLHDSLITFQKDEKIYHLTREDIPSAKDRLKYVVELTEQAAQKVLGVIEKCIPISLAIRKGANYLESKYSEDSEGPETSNITNKTKSYLAGVRENADVLHSYLTEILMTQEYQDITGQIIKKVIDLVQDVENNLVRLIRLTGNISSPISGEESDIKPSGPRVPDVDNQAVYTTDQDDVDQLLASLGF